MSSFLLQRTPSMLYQNVISYKANIHIKTAKCFCNTTQKQDNTYVEILGIKYPTDTTTNVTPRILSKIGWNLHHNKRNPLFLLKERIKKHMYTSFKKSTGNPVFSIFDNLSPVVTLDQNFDSLLVPQSHVSRRVSDSYYINSSYMLRAHTSAHQRDLLQMGFDAFMVFGDVYRRDAIDKSHYPIFHQADGLRCFTQRQVFENVRDSTDLQLFENSKRTPEKQEKHSMDTAKLIEHDLKQTLLSLAYYLFGKDIKARWVEATFPFTHPSWELEIWYYNEWMEVLGCGIVEQAILDKAGACNKVGWAFGLGLERLAMKLYEIPDIRLFWSKDAGFLNQFNIQDYEIAIKYRPISIYPPCINDISFWIPDNYHENDFYDLVREVGGDLVEQVNLFDSFFHPKKMMNSHAYRITYRSMDKTLTQDEVNSLHSQIGQKAEQKLCVDIRDK